MFTHRKSGTELTQKEVDFLSDLLRATLLVVAATHQKMNDDDTSKEFFAEMNTEAVRWLDGNMDLHDKPNVFYAEFVTAMQSKALEKLGITFDA